MLRRSLPALLVLARPARAAELRVLSAGAVEPGLAAALRGFPDPVRVDYATAPRLRERLRGGETPDVLVAPLALLEEVAARLTGPILPIGKVGVGIVVRPGAPEPAITDAASLRAAIEQADAVVFNQASTGQYMERLFERLGLASVVASKARRHPTGAAVLADLAASPDRDLGFAAVTEIRLDPAMRFLGPLPPALQNATAYGAAAVAGADGAALLRWLGSSAARRAFAAAGVEE